jgi:hypothetical protein
MGERVPLQRVWVLCRVRALSLLVGFWFFGTVVLVPAIRSKKANLRMSYLPMVWWYQTPHFVIPTV